MKKASEEAIHLVWQEIKDDYLTLIGMDPKKFVVKRRTVEDLKKDYEDDYDKILE